MPRGTSTSFANMPVMKIHGFCFVTYFTLTIAIAAASAAAPADAPANLLPNPNFEQVAATVLPSAWQAACSARPGVNIRLETTAGGNGRTLRLAAVPNAFTACRGATITVAPETDYWISWRFKAAQPESCRTYLFLQTNLGQRVFREHDATGDFAWTACVAKYHTLPGETWIAPTLTMHAAGQPGDSWWDDVGVWRQLPASLEVEYRRRHPWDDVPAPTAIALVRGDGWQVWADRAEARIGPTTAAPKQPPSVAPIELVAPGGGHDQAQLVISSETKMGPIEIEPVPPHDAGRVDCRLVRTVNVTETRNPQFPHGPTADPLVEAARATAAPGENAIFWIQWSAARGARPGMVDARLRIRSGGKPLAEVPLRLRRWGFDLPEMPHFRSMVMISPWFLKRFYPAASEDDLYGLAWKLLDEHRLAGFNITLSPSLSIKDGRLVCDWARFDRRLAEAKKYRAGAITIGPMLGGGCGEGWKPGKFLGMMPLENPDFDRHYVELYRQIAARLREAGMLERAYVYPYDEPEPDYLDKIVRLLDLVHRGDPGLKCLMTVDPALAEPLYGKVQAWIVPHHRLGTAAIARRRAAGDEVWAYNLIAGIEDRGLAHRLFMWKGFSEDVRGGLLWNCCWWNKINPWENPTAASVPVGRQRERLYRYQAGEASLFYPALDGKGPLVPSLRLKLIRQGVEDFDLFAGLLAAWKQMLPRLGISDDSWLAQCRTALVEPLMDGRTPASHAFARAAAIRRLVGNQLEAATRGPAAITWFRREAGQLKLYSAVEPGARLTVNGRPVALQQGRLTALPFGEKELRSGIRFSATRSCDSVQWEWPRVE